MTNRKFEKSNKVIISVTGGMVGILAFAVVAAFGCGPASHSSTASSSSKSDGQSRRLPDVVSVGDRDAIEFGTSSETAVIFVRDRSGKNAIMLSALTDVPEIRLFKNGKSRALRFEDLDKATELPAER